MKNILLLLNFCVGAGILNAQPVLNQNRYIPSVGTSVSYYVIDSTFSPGGAGANQTWNFTGMKKYPGLTNTIHFVSPNQTAYGLQFSSSAYADTSDTQNTTYYSYNASELFCDGYIFDGGATLGDVVVKFSSNKEKIMNFPFTYSDMFTDNFSGNISNSFGLTGTVSGTATVTADAYGTLQLPMGVTLNNVLRVKIVESATVITMLGTFNLNSTAYFYIDTANTTAVPVLKFYDVDFNGNQQKWVHSLYDAPVISGTQEYQMASLPFIYPNPARDRVYVSCFGNQPVRIEVMDVSGKIVKEIQCTAGAVLPVDITEVPSGLYLVRIFSEDEGKLYKMIKE